MGKPLYMEWIDENKLNVPILDEEIRALYALLNSIHYFLEQSYYNLTNKDEVVNNPFVKLFEKFADIHFMTEEKLMKQTDYPEILEHVNEHKQIVKEFEGFYQKVLDSGKDEDVMDALDFQKIWWQKHIADADSKFVLFYKRLVSPTPLYIIWNEKYELGVPIVDEQHRGFVAVVNTFQYFIRAGWTDGLIDRVDSSHPFEVALQEYMKVHFKTEEKLMVDSNYVDIVKHRNEHLKISENLHKVGVLARKSTDSTQGLKFLKNWWLNHIQQEDLKFVEYYKAWKSGQLLQ